MEFKKPSSKINKSVSSLKPNKEKLTNSQRDLPSICLAVMVKNEAKIIQRMFSSAIPFIDYWVILDTGSTDNTKEIVESFKNHVPGELHESVFIDFEQSRNQLLKLCKEKGDYVLLLDADMIFHCELTKENLKNELIEPGYYLQHQNAILKWWNWRIIDIKNYVWEYVGVTHEVLVPLVVPKPPNEWQNVMMNCAFIKDIGDGGSKQDKLQRDIRLLTTALSKEKRVPVKFHYLFYLGQSYFFLAGDPGQTPEDAKELKFKAIMTFQDAIRFSKTNSGIDQEELWATHFYLAQAMYSHGAYGFHKVVEVYTACHNLRPFRMENKTDLMFICNRNELWHLSYLWGSLALEPFEASNKNLTLRLVSSGQDKLLLRMDYQLVSFWDEFLQASFNLGEINVALSCCKHLVKNHVWTMINSENQLRVYKNIETVLKANWIANTGKKLDQVPSNLMESNFPDLYAFMNTNSEIPSSVEEITILPSKNQTPTLQK